MKKAKKYVKINTPSPAPVLIYPPGMYNMCERGTSKIINLAKKLKWNIRWSAEILDSIAYKKREITLCREGPIGKPDFVKTYRHKGGFTWRELLKKVLLFEKYVRPRNPCDNGDHVYFKCLEESRKKGQRGYLYVWFGS